MSRPDSPRRLRRTLYTIVLVVVGGAVLAPVAVYLFGVNLIAPYAGEGGALGFLGSVYGDALQGRAAAWALLLSPAVFVLTWWAVFRLMRLGKTRASAAD
ncbi:MAG: hypothetical protein JSV45_03775 [Chromatiales bacterium]|nr:MAG: hypothetical protein JSV45_03775 [Chromatiales bacterium]